jgi:autotransporter-associated beta strand protein
LILANNNQDAGGVQVDGGVLTLSGTSNNPVNYSTTNTVSDVKPGATLKLGNTQVGLIYYDGGTFNMSGGTFDVNGQNPAADQDHSAPVVSGSGTITNSVAATTGTALFKIGSNKTFSGNITDGAGSAKVAKVAITITSGGSTWTLSGNNTYSGATTISSGIIQAGSTTAFSPNSAYSIASGKTLALANFNNAIGSLTGAGNVTLGTGTLTIGGDNTTPAAFTGVISGGTGGALIKTGAGTLTLGGGNTYSGGTTVNQGTLLVTNAAGTGPISVSSGGTLAGNSTLAPATTISGTHAPGNSGVGIQTFSGGLAYTASARLQWQLTDNVTTGRGTVFDGVDITGGTFAIATGAVIDLTFSGTVNFTNTFWDTARTWTLADLGAGVTGTGGTETLAIGTITGGSYNISEGSFSVSRLADGSGKNDVVLTWTPYSYEVWRIAKITNINGSASSTPAADPDLDGHNNLAEFAYGSDPLSAAGQTKIFPKTTDDLGNRASILTIAVRTGTPAFTGSPSPSAAADGITYTIQGASTIGIWDASVTPLATPAIAGLPAPGSGYEYRSFTLTGSSGQPGSGFLRAIVTKP